MKTAEDKVNGIANWTNQGMRQAVIDLLKDDRNEIKQLIDRMKGNPEGMELTKEEYHIYLCGYDDALTEFKSKMGI
ncbi:hypothetical protein LCGC14_2193450 [marine sediment metagenome]|uniref:Uncharacterized protein n=1 Tax=marine sediment metagenome TaxID=412755 RepID=A0A0F9DIV3_9ZZZZ